MARALVVTTEPSAEPVTVDEAKLFARIDSSDDNTWIEAAIKAARQMAEVKLRRALITQTLTLYLDDFPNENYIRLPRAPLISVTSVKYYDTSGTQQTMTENTDYKVDTNSSPGRVYLPRGETWPSTYDEPRVIEIAYQAGYGSSGADVPEAIRQWILVQVNGMDKAREPVVIGTIASKMPRSSIDGLLDPYTIPYIGED